MSEETRMTQVSRGERGLALNDLDEMFRFAKFVCDSAWAPKGDTPAGVVVKLQAGAELGFAPMQSLATLTAINGKVGIMGDGAVALIEAAGVLKEPILRSTEGTGDKMVGVCTSWRKGKPEPYRSEFSVAQAKRARLWGKGGPWSDYPERMLTYRALGFHTRDYYSDVIKGLTIAEELHDYPRAAATVTATIEPPKPDPLLEEADEDGVAIPDAQEQEEIKAAEIKEASDDLPF